MANTAQMPQLAPHQPLLTSGEFFEIKNVNFILFSFDCPPGFVIATDFCWNCLMF
jgi:hypothetical protein